jgi:hypothetical protein
MIAFEICEDLSLLPSYLTGKVTVAKPLTKIMLREMQIEGA